MTTRADLRAALANRNVIAFLRVIREGEAGQTDEAYRKQNGGYVFPTYQVEHPSKGLKSPPGKAFGAYQFLASTWAGLVKRYGFPDMTPQCQDEGAVALIIGRGALDEVMAGDLEGAFQLLETEWTSLPGGAEQNAATARARETYIRWGGLFEPAEAPSAERPAIETQAPASQDDAGEAIATAPVPSPQPIPQEAPMGFLAALLPSLFSAAPDLIRLLGKGPMSERNAVVAEKVFAVAKQVTGAVNEQEAVRRIEGDPAAAAAFKAAVAENFDQWMGMMVKFQEMDEASRAKARDFAVAYGREPVAWRFTFVELLSLVFVVVAALGGGYVLWNPGGRFTTEMQTAVVMLMLIGGWNGVKEFWLGSSMSSMRKDQTINQQSKGTTP